MGVETPAVDSADKDILAAATLKAAGETIVQPPGVVSGAPPPPPALSGIGAGLADGDGEWWFQEATTGQPAGPWTIEQLRARWRRSQIDGFTPVWRHGFHGWQPLSEVAELKSAFREAEVVSDATGVSSGAGDSLESSERGAVAYVAAEVDERPAKRIKRTPLDDVPLTHTYTSDQGELYVYDTVDEDWKVTTVYERLVALEAEEANLAASQQVVQGSTAACNTAVQGMPPVHGSTTGPSPVDEIDQELALQELLADAAAVKTGFIGLGIPSRASGCQRAATASAPEAFSEAVGSVGCSSSIGSAVGGSSAASEPIASGGAPVPPDPAKAAKAQKRHEYRERRKLKKQAGLFVKAQENPNVYVSGLPPDVTAKELEAVFKRAGVFKLDLATGEAKIRIYTDDAGTKCKGDALVSYANAASVQLAVDFLHEFELRPHCRICVQQADFQELERGPRLSKDDLKKLAAAKDPTGAERARYLAAKSAQKEAVSWSGDMDDGTGRRIVVLKHMFSEEEARTEGLQFYVELSEEIREECEKFGHVIKVTPMERHRLGIVCVKFQNSSDAEECIRVMDGRFFAQRKVEASFYDGRTDLRALGAGRGTASNARKAISATAVPAAPGGNRNVPGLEASSDGAGGNHDPAGTAGSTSIVTDSTLASETGQLKVDPPAATLDAKSVLLGAAAVVGNIVEATTQSAAPAGEDKGNQPSWEDWLNNQSSDSDSELRVREEGGSDGEDD